MEDWKTLVFIDVFHVKRSPEGTNSCKEPEMHTTQNGWLAPRISKNRVGRHHAEKAACESKGFLYRRLGF